MRTIITILHNDSATGIKTIEFSNRLIKGIYVPRVDLKHLKDFEIPEACYSGVYFLIWEDESWDTQVYIWQAVNIQNRLEQHTKNEGKDFWKYAVAFTNKEASLTESDINYLEKKLINLAKETERAKIENKSSGNTCLIPQNRKADMLDFLADLEILLSSLGFPFLKPYSNTKDWDKNSLDTYYLSMRWANAVWKLTQEGFLVYKWSTWRKEMTKSMLKDEYAPIERSILFEKWIIKEEWDKIIFLKDYLFRSPSGASCCISWAFSNGWTIWKNKSGKTLDEMERQK